MRQAVQIFQPSFYDQLADFGGTGQVPDGVMEFKKIAVGKPAHIVEAPVGQAGFPAGRGKRPPVTAGALARAMAYRIGAGSFVPESRSVSPESAADSGVVAADSCVCAGGCVEYPEI